MPFLFAYSIKQVFSWQGYIKRLLSSVLHKKHIVVLNSVEYPQHMFLWRSTENYPWIVIKYPPSLLFQELLYDPFPNIRRLSVTGVLQVMKAYWEVIPAETLKNLVVTIIQDLLVDANSSGVRQSVIKVRLEGWQMSLFGKPLSKPFSKP